jgi:hypothetical protein
MNAGNDNAAPEGPRGRWSSPPRSGMQRIISPWEYRHLRPWAGVRIAAGTVLIGVGVVTFAFGGNDAKTYGWTMGFLALAAANLAFASWELRIAGSAAART